MKKPLRGDGMAFSELLYGNEVDNNIGITSHKNNSKGTCPGPNIAQKDASNMAKASRNMNTDSNTSYRIFQQLKGKYCAECLIQFKKKFWSEMERE